MNSPANIVGLILAISVVVLHLIVGLGALWPVVAIAVWGAAVAALPRQSKSPRQVGKSPQGGSVASVGSRRRSGGKQAARADQKSVDLFSRAERRLSLDPKVLNHKLDKTMWRIPNYNPNSPFLQAARQLDQILRSVLDEWSYLEDYPEQRVVIAGIIEDYYPETVDSFLAVPKRLRSQAEAPATDSIDLLYKAVEKIQNAIGQDNMRALEGQRDSLALQFGKLIDYEPRPETP